ncbi:MAG: ABC transporter permease [Treponemataceae bacterium]|nr:MAG: ABC transporter permease [Treponemataceae bacterium]
MTAAASLFFASKMILPHHASSSGGRKSLAGAIVCIALSLIPLIVVLTVVDGMIQGITSRMIGLSSYHLRVYPPSGAEQENAGADTEDSGFSIQNPELLSNIASCGGVTGVFPEKQGIALAAGPSGRIGVTVRAVPRDLFTANKDFAALFTLTEGGFDMETSDAAARYSAIIGSKVSSELGIHPGDIVRIITLRTGAAGIPLPRSASFTVAGAVSSGYQELDSFWVFIPLDAGERVISPSSSQSFIGVTTADPFSRSLDAALDNIAEVLPEDWAVYPWNDFNSAQYENFASTKTMLVFIQILIVLVASVNISSALLILAIERRREIAILKSLGATSGGISFSFLLTGLYAGLCGVILGVPPGILCAVNVNEIITVMEKAVNMGAEIVFRLGSSESFSQVHLLDPAYYLQEIPVVLPLAQLIGIVCGTLALSVLAAVAPSIRAGREKPVKTLSRH